MVPRRRADSRRAGRSGIARVAVRIRPGEVRRVGHVDVADHLVVDVAAQHHEAGRVECHRRVGLALVERQLESSRRRERIDLVTHRCRCWGTRPRFPPGPPGPAARTCDSAGPSRQCAAGRIGAACDGSVATATTTTSGTPRPSRSGRAGRGRRPTRLDARDQRRARQTASVTQVARRCGAVREARRTNPVLARG